MGIDITTGNKADARHTQVQSLTRINSILFNGSPGSLGGLQPTSIVPAAGDYVKRTVTNVASTYGQVIPVDATHCLLEVESQSIRIRFDNTDPTSTTGHLYAAGSRVILSAEVLRYSRFIRAGGSDGTIHVSYFKPL